MIKTSNIVLIGFRQFDNLGMGYIASVMSEAGYFAEIIDVREPKEDILIKINRYDPIIIGFSVIFMNHIYEFRDLITYLRGNGVQCHFSAGGHYASLRYGDLFRLIPSLDSIVRFEGETTFLELAGNVDAGLDWKTIQSIAYKQDNKIVLNPLRPLVKDIDVFPWPKRNPLKEYVLGRKFATMLAGRGCIYDCAYCDIREFYKTPSGPVKRTRMPEEIIKEMEFLHVEEKGSIFLFEDDDFPVRTQYGSEWINGFCQELSKRNLFNKVMWKINCRPDEIEYDSFKKMKEHGLYLVFLGIEDGTDAGLSRFNKQMTVEKSLAGISILKKLDIGFDYGFMLFQPWSTFDTIRENLNFLKEICKDGFTAVSWLKMLPFFETRVEQELKKEDRIKGEPGFLDYDFLNPFLNKYYEFTSDCFSEWLLQNDGLLNLIKWARNYLSVFNFFYMVTPNTVLLKNEIRRICSLSNIFILDKMIELLIIFEEGRHDHDNYFFPESFKTEIKIQHNQYKSQITKCIRVILNQAALQELSKSIYI